MPVARVWRRRSVRSFRPTSRRRKPTASATGRWHSARRDERWRADGHLYPAFPYDSYTLMSDQEVADLYVALMATPAVNTPSTPHQVGFRFNIFASRWRGERICSSSRSAWSPMRAKSDEWNRGKYITFGPGLLRYLSQPAQHPGRPRRRQGAVGQPPGGPGGKAPSILKADLEKHEVHRRRAGADVHRRLRGLRQSGRRDGRSDPRQGLRTGPKRTSARWRFIC